MPLPQIPEHDPVEGQRLQDICLEIEQVMTKHGVCGFVGVVSKSYSHFLYHIDEPWSALRFVNGELKLQSGEQFGQTQAQAEESLRNTAGAVAMLHQIAEHLKKSFLSILLTMSQRIQIFTASTGIKPE